MADSRKPTTFCIQKSNKILLGCFGESSVAILQFEIQTHEKGSQSRQVSWNENCLRKIKKFRICIYHQKLYINSQISFNIQMPKIVDVILKQHSL
ncbi:unnamed protein product [Paramecium octaurelia]|uniref:Uncharacterized protein n=1 Tax=Paramecium octaurelia TaxID=43137 RepID=A0A8S1XWV2_PAROT|nr:unnamed protein product [Paramecium octaurelia]